VPSQKKIAELQKQYEEELAKLNAEPDDDDDTDDGDIIILKGNAAKRLMDRLMKMGLTEDEAEEVVEEAEENAGEEEPEEEVDEKPVPKGKAKPKETEPPVVEDPKPPTRSRYFGGSK